MGSQSQVNETMAPEVHVVLAATKQTDAGHDKEQTEAGHDKEQTDAGHDKEQTD